MRLLLNEMISWRLAAELRRRGHDVVSVKRDRPDLAQTSDPHVLVAAVAERRAVVTNNVRDYREAHRRMLERGATHYGIIYTHDDVLPRNRQSIPLWVASLDRFLTERPDETALLDQTTVLAPPEDV